MLVHGMDVQQLTQRGTLTLPRIRCTPATAVSNGTAAIITEHLTAPLGTPQSDV